MFDIKKNNILFKNLVYRDLRVYVDSLGGKVMYYKDRYNLECDFILEFDNNRYAFVNTALVNSFIDDAIKNLLKLKELFINSNKKIGNIAFMMIITGGTNSYITKDKVLVVPIGCLKN